MPDSPATEADRFASLTEGQRDCLRLVRQAKKSEVIAAELGISKHTVDKRIESAMAKLGAPTRAIAALKLERHEGGYEPLAYEPLAVDRPPMIIQSGRTESGPSEGDGQPSGRIVDMPVTGRVFVILVLAIAAMSIFAVAFIARDMIDGAVRAPTTAANDA